MAVDPRYQRLSVEEYFRLVQTSQDVKYEYEHGQVRALAGGTSNHAEIAGNMYVALREQLGRGTPRAYIADKVIQVAEGRYYIPDVVVSCDVSDHGKSLVICSPHLIVEVLSPSTELIDRTKKLAAYQACPHVQEIVFISQQVQFVELFRRAHADDEDAWHYLQYHSTGTIMLDCLDIQIPVSELYEGLAIPLDDEER